MSFHAIHFLVQLRLKILVDIFLYLPTSLLHKLPYFAALRDGHERTYTYIISDTIHTNFQKKKKIQGQEPFLC